MTDTKTRRGESRAYGTEWPTLLIIALTYLTWAVATTWLASVSLPLAVVACTLAGAQHSSLTHEVLHGHPFRNPTLNAALVFPALTVFVPYLRFRDTHLAHHNDETLTDPYDDPESNYLDPALWAAMPRWQQMLHRWNNTLAGRLVIGPVLGQIAFMKADWALIRAGNQRVLNGWLWHLPSVALVLLWMTAVAQMPIWAWLVSVYLSLSILKLRTYLEHRAHDRATGRTVVVEDRGLFALLFLNNNLHMVHHMHPGAPWYILPKLYRNNRESYLTRNLGYRYDTYRDIFRKYLFRAKDPVPHPLYPGGQDK